MMTEKEFKYYDPLKECPISTDELQGADDETQTEVLRHWFYERYEDPAENTPHDSSEGGYFYLCGGPHDALDVLSDNFWDIVPEGVITALASELSDQSPEWAGKPSAEDFDDYLVEEIVLNSKYHHYFGVSMSFVANLLESNVNTLLESRFHRLLYANVITALETYLSDAFIYTVLSDEEMLRKLVENDKYFQKKKIRMSEIFDEYESLNKQVKEYLMTITWHNLPRAKSLFDITFGIIFPSEMTLLIAAVLKRHDIVHRNGKNRDGKELLFKKQDVKDLVTTATSFVDSIDIKLSILKGNITKG